MLIATPAYGSHYVIDVIAGGVVAAAGWIVVARILGAASETQKEPFAVIHAPSIVSAALPPPATVLSRKFESVRNQPT
jgi:membrane-associated phospholipid phosphatase